MRTDLAAAYRMAAIAAGGGVVQAVSLELGTLTQRQWVGDGSAWDGDLEWPALLRRLDRYTTDDRD